jgi:hypothetical protein
MVPETITESAFLLTELRYTLGQLHVQALDLDDEARRGATYNGKNIEDTLQEMVGYEKEYQSRYAQLLHSQSAPTTVQNDDVPLPVSHADEAAGTESDFEHLRAKTINMIEAVPEPWPAELAELVKEHVARDRQSTTQIAEARKSWLSNEQRPDLEEPLTTKNEPHVLSDQTASS